MQKYYLAIDIGASSGRHIVGVSEGETITLEEVYRFPNGMVRSEEGLVWNTAELFTEIVKGIALCIKKVGKIESLAIDTWGVDYALLRGGELIPPVYAYRSDRTEKAINEVHKRIAPEKLYAVTGEQFQPFNTIYQLYADKQSGRLDAATDFLMMPEYFNYLLTGKKVKEYTNATTGAFVNARTGEFDREIVETLGFPLGFPPVLFQPLHFAGEEVGDLKPEIQKQVGGNIKVKLCASHDTACAFEAVETEEHSVLISSGTWSLVGAKIKNADTSERSFRRNFANEGGVGYFRYLKNIMGMWIVNNLAKELGMSAIEAEKAATLSSYDRTFNVNHPSLVAPASMMEAVETLLGERLSPADLFASVFHSLAASYAETVKEIEETLGAPVTKIYIVGGGAKNKFLNELTEKHSKKPVVAMPIEATALGNLKIQMEADA